MRWIALLVGLICVTTIVHAEQTPSWTQTSIDAIFIVDRAANHTTAMYSFRYANPTEETVRWILPLPPGTESVQIGLTLLPLYTQFQTEPSIEPPYRGGCQLSPDFVHEHGRMPISYNYPPIDSNVNWLHSAEAAYQFLTATGLVLSKGKAAALASYGARGYSFAALTIQPDVEADAEVANDAFGSIGIHLAPIVVAEFSGVEPILPLRFRASSLATHLDNYNAEDFMPVTTYIFSDVPYASENFSAAQVDLTQIHARENELISTMRLTTSVGPFLNQFDPIYYRLVLEEIGKQEGRAFIAEFVGQPGAFALSEPSDAQQDAYGYFDQLRESHQVLTRLRTFVHERDAIPDAIFQPNPNATNLRMDLAEAVDAAWFWGCTSRKLIDIALEARLPEGRSYLEALHLSLAHPLDWQLSVIERHLEPIYVLSPEVVTLERLRAMEQGQGGPPMLVVQKVQTRYQPGLENLVDVSYDWFTWNSGSNFHASPARNAFTVIRPSPEAQNPDLPINGVRVALLSSYADWAMNETLYNDMLAYASSYQYFLSPTLRHTLFIGQLSNLVAVGYPDGWIEGFDSENNRLLLPIGTIYDNAPIARTRNLSSRGSIRAAARRWYDLPYDLELLALDLIPFESNGRRGYLIFTNREQTPLIEFSAPIAQFAEYADLLRLMASTVRTEWGESPE